MDFVTGLLPSDDNATILTMVYLLDIIPSQMASPRRPNNPWGVHCGVSRPVILLPGVVFFLG